MSGPALAVLLLAANGGAPAVEALRNCWTDAVEAELCIGGMVESCIAGRPDGETTAGTAACIAAEAEAWDVLLNEEYQVTMAEARALDATGDVVAPDLTRAETLRDAQRAWIAFRDAECRAQYARWGTGTMRQIAGANCIMVETAERAIELRRMREP